MAKVLQMYHDPLYQLSRHLKKKRRKVYVALEWMDHIWDEKEVNKVRIYWERGMDYLEIAEVIGRDEYEILALILDQVKQGKIEIREGGIWGNTQK